MYLLDIAPDPIEESVAAASPVLAFLVLGVAVLAVIGIAAFLIIRAITKK